MSTVHPAFSYNKIVGIWKNIKKKKLRKFTFTSNSSIKYGYNRAYDKLSGKKYFFFLIRRHNYEVIETLTHSGRVRNITDQNNFIIHLSSKISIIPINETWGFACNPIIVFITDSRIQVLDHNRTFIMTKIIEKISIFRKRPLTITRRLRSGTTVALESNMTFSFVGYLIRCIRLNEYWGNVKIIVIQGSRISTNTHARVWRLSSKRYVCMPMHVHTELFGAARTPRYGRFPNGDPNQSRPRG